MFGSLPMGAEHFHHAFRVFLHKIAPHDHTAVDSPDAFTIIRIGQNLPVALPLRQRGQRFAGQVSVNVAPAEGGSHVEEVDTDKLSVLIGIEPGTGERFPQQDFMHCTGYIADFFAFQIPYTLDAALLHHKRGTFVAERGDKHDGFPARGCLDRQCQRGSGHIEAARQQSGFLIARIGERVHLHRCAVRKRLIQERLDGLGRFPCAYVPRFRRQRRHTQGQGQYEGQEQFSHVVRLRRQGSYRPLAPCLGGEPPPKPRQVRSVFLPNSVRKKNGLLLSRQKIPPRLYLPKKRPFPR